MVVESEPSLFVCLPTFVLEKDWQETTQSPVTRIRISKKPYLRCSVLSSRNLGRKGESKDRKRSGFGVSCDELKAGLSLDTIPEEAAITLSFFG